MTHTQEFLKRHSLATGLVLMFALTWPFYSHVGLFVGYGLALASLIMTGLTLGWAGVRALLSRFLIWRIDVRWYLVTLLGPAVLTVAAVGLGYALGGAELDFGSVDARWIFGRSTNLWVYVVPFFLVDLITNGEEMGWRGYVLPRLRARYSALASSLILGAVWGLWHLPKFWAAGDAAAVVWAILHNIAMAVLFTWVYENTSGSLLIATLFHAATNTAGVFLPMASIVMDGVTIQMIAIGIEFVAAFAFVLATGPARLSRRSPAQVRL
jgi:membrane protease YdiL (CAAX protease family)